MAAPRKGEIIDGYEFLGGDPNDQRSWQQWGPGARSLPDGSVVRDGPRGGLQWLRKAEQGQGGEPLREFEINAAARATLMDEGQREYQRARQDGYDPGHWKNQIASGLEGAPLVGTYAADVIRDNPSERGRIAELQFAEGALRTTTGANAPDKEVRNASRMYFRQAGESQGVERNKQQIRDRFRNTAVKAAGRAFIPSQEGQAGKPLPKSAEAAYVQGVNSGRFKREGAYGTQTRPFLARDEATLKRLPKGAYVIAPNGDFGVIE